MSAEVLLSTLQSGEDLLFITEACCGMIPLMSEGFLADVMPSSHPRPPPATTGASFLFLERAFRESLKQSGGPLTFQGLTANIICQTTRVE